MRKIHFNEETIEQIRQFINEGHSLDETCNRFTLKYDTLRRVMFENNIQAHFQNKASHKRSISSEDVDLICSLYRNTKMRIQDIVKECKLPNYVVQKILDDHFSEEYQNKRKSSLYRDSKLGDLNPLKGVTGWDNPHYIGGVVEDGHGYLMETKPTWWTSRKNADYVFQHHVVVAKALGLTEIPKGFVVHHIDGNPKNNDINNLALMCMGAHSKWHTMLKNLCKVQRLSDKE